ncbi:hypothetical protein J7L48_04535, partial [bacterium]|nr:hypothetical protein [bacterium]
ELILLYNGKKYRFRNHKIISGGKTIYEDLDISVFYLDNNLYEIVLELKKIKFKISIVKKGEIYGEKRI